jgi:hypothetical protein
MALQPLIGPLPLLQFRNLFYTVGRTPWTRDQPVTWPLPKHRITQRHNKRTQTSMPGVGFEPMIPAFKRTKTVLALDRAATVIGSKKVTAILLSFQITSFSCMPILVVQCSYRILYGQSCLFHYKFDIVNGSIT